MCIQNDCGWWKVVYSYVCSTDGVFNILKFQSVMYFQLKRKLIEMKSLVTSKQMGGNWFEKLINHFWINKRTNKARKINLISAIWTKKQTKCIENEWLYEIFNHQNRRRIINTKYYFKRDNSKFICLMWMSSIWIVKFTFITHGRH